MGELRHLRSMVEDTIKRIHLSAFVYEKSYAEPRSVLETSLRKVEEADILVALFAQSLGDVTVKEFRHARMLNKPCFVYVEKKEFHRQDLALTDFLEREVYNSSLGVSYSLFDDAASLAERIARDLVAYLSTVYRNSIRTLPVGVIPPALRLAWDVEDWYKAVLRCELPNSPTWVNSRIIDLPVRWKTNTSTFEQRTEELTITCVSGRVTNKDAQFLIERNQEDRSLVISDREFTPEARKTLAKRGACEGMTFDELLERTIRFDSYLDWLLKRIKD